MASHRSIHQKDLDTGAVIDIHDSDAKFFVQQVNGSDMEEEGDQTLEARERSFKDSVHGWSKLRRLAK